jgi:formylglycine-generating enzyme required for sulfatase activity
MRLSDVAVVLTIIVAIIAISTFIADLWSLPGQESTPTSTPPVALTQTLPPTNNPPAAFVDSIKPNPARQEQSVTFSCHGDDPDTGDYITEYRWESSIDGFLSNQKTFPISSLTSGSHQIILRVKDTHGRWSSEITRNLRVEAIEIPPTEINDTTPEPSITPTPTPTLKPTPTPTADLGETFTNTIGMEFVTIPAGEFEMGSPSDEEGRFENEGLVHPVNIKKAFHMCRYEVTQKQWRAIMGDNPSYFTGDDLPVEWVSWDGVQEFIKKLNEKEGTDKYRLPSEAEWEYACRAGTTTRYSFGDSKSKLGDYAWYTDNSDKKTHPVGQKKPNSWGLYDMHGNVWEWVQDRWHSNYDGAPADGSAWEGDDANRVIRGGGWLDYAAGYCRSAFRSHGSLRGRGNAIGFRILKEQ